MIRAGQFPYRERTGRARIMERHDRILAAAIACAALVYSLGLVTTTEAQCPNGQEFQDGVSTVIPTASGIQIAVADLNGDGLPDVAGVNGTFLVISLQSAGTPPVFTTTSYALDGPGF